MLRRPVIRKDNIPRSVFWVTWKVWKSFEQAEVLSAEIPIGDFFRLRGPVIGQTRSNSILRNWRKILTALPFKGICTRFLNAVWSANIIVKGTADHHGQKEREALGKKRFPKTTDRRLTACHCAWKKQAFVSPSISKICWSDCRRPMLVKEAGARWSRNEWKET